MRRRPEVWAMVGLALWLACFWRGPLINDIGWQLWIGRQINQGAILYVDILEVNPPLWFWFGAVVQQVASFTNIAAPALLTSAFAAFAATAVFLSRTLVPDTRERGLLYAGLILTLFLTSPFALGQREQFTFIVTTPYIALITRRAEGQKVDARLAVSVALFAALGFALKHYFALVPIALEAWLLWRSRRITIRPELLALCLAAISYAATIILFTPEYVTTMVPLIRLAYHGYNPPFLEQVNQPALFVAVFSLVALTFKRAKTPVLAMAACVTTLAFGTTYLLQAKGFHYHAVPVLGAALLSLLIGFGAVREGNSGSTKAAAAIALILAVITPFVAGRARHDEAAAFATASLSSASSIVMLSASGVAAWPLIEERGFGWPSRHMTLWMLVPVWQGLKKGEISPELDGLARRTRLEVASEIACSRPAMILVDSRYDEIAAGGDLLRFFLEEPQFAQVMQAYRRSPDAQYLRVYRRVDPLVPAQTSLPRCTGSHPVLAYSSIDGVFVRTKVGDGRARNSVRV